MKVRLLSHLLTLILIALCRRDPFCFWLLRFCVLVPLRFARLAYFNYLSFARVHTYTVRLRFAFLFLRLCTLQLVSNVEASIAYVAASWQRQHQKSVAASATHLEVEARTRNRKHDRSLACRNEAAKVCL